MQFWKEYKMDKLHGLSIDFENGTPIQIIHYENNIVKYIFLKK